VISAAIIHYDDFVIRREFLQGLIRQNDEIGDRATVIEAREKRTNR
jgi:hypothetical protein